MCFVSHPLHFSLRIPHAINEGTVGITCAIGGITMQMNEIEMVPLLHEDENASGRKSGLATHCEVPNGSQAYLKPSLGHVCVSAPLQDPSAYRSVT